MSLTWRAAAGGFPSMHFTDQDLRAAVTRRRARRRTIEPAARLPQRPRRDFAGRAGAALRSRASALVRRRADRDGRHGPVLDARVLRHGRLRAHRDRARLRRRLHRRRPLPLAPQEPARAGRPPHRHRGVDGAARGLRHPGRARPVGPLRPGRHRARLLCLDQRQLAPDGDRRHRRGADRAVALSLSLHRA